MPRSKRPSSRDRARCSTCSPAATCACRVPHRGRTAAPATAADIAVIARRLSSVFVLYWLTDDELCIWVVPPEGPTHARRVSVLRARLTELVRSTALELESAPARPAAWRELYDLLIAPIADVLPRTPGALLTIVPDGPLHHLSFAALQDARGRYLLERYALHYVPGGRRCCSSPDPCAAPTPERETCCSSPTRCCRRCRVWTARCRACRAREMRRTPSPARAARAHDATDRRGGHRAGSARGGRRSARRALRHARRCARRRSAGIVSGARTGAARMPAADGVLTAAEIYDWKLHADLVVLSACRSAGGRVTGDGIATFARAFIYAGTPTLVASLWDVADEPTNRLLPAFYRSWLGGQSKARALARRPTRSCWPTCARDGSAADRSRPSGAARASGLLGRLRAHRRAGLTTRPTLASDSLDLQDQRVARLAGRIRRQHVGEVDDQDARLGNREHLPRHDRRHHRRPL